MNRVLHRGWVFPLNKKVDDVRLLEEVRGFVGSWKVHGEPIQGRSLLILDQFLLLAVEPTSAQASGCSIDSMKKAILELTSRYGIGLMNETSVCFAYKSKDGVLSEFHELSRVDFKKHLLETDQDIYVFDGSKVNFDLSAESYSLEEEIIQPISDSWASYMLAE